MNNALFFEQIQVGNTWRSQKRTITQADITSFAGLTGDFNPLHMDHEFARRSPFGRPIAHGLLGLSLVAGLGSHAPLVNTLAFVAVDDWQFLKPAYIGDTVYVLTEVVETRPSGRRAGQVTWRRQLLNQDDQVIQSGLFKTLVQRGDVAPRRVDRNAIRSSEAENHEQDQAREAPTQNR